MLVIVYVTGPCGARKSSTARAIAQRFQFLFVGIGEWARKTKHVGQSLQASSEGNDDMVPYMLSNEQVFQLLGQARERCEQLGFHGMVVDGFPRTPSQLEYIQEQLVDHSSVRPTKDRIVLVQMRASPAFCLDRIQNRYLDPVTGIKYHLDGDRLPEKQGRSPQEAREIRSRLVKRQDDVLHIAVLRLRQHSLFHQQLESWLQVWGSRLAASIHVASEASPSERKRAWEVPIKQYVLSHHPNRME